MRLPPRAGRSRRAIASLEFVLVFPFLLILVSVLFIVGRADVAKVQAVTGTRNQTWANRPGPSGSPLIWPHNPMNPPLSLPATQPVSLAPVISRQPGQAQSQVTLVANPWAFQSVPFPSASDQAIPHTSVLKMLPSPAGAALAATCQAMALSYPATGASAIQNFVGGLVKLVGNTAVQGVGWALVGSVFASYPGIKLLGAAYGKSGSYF